MFFGNLVIIVEGDTEYACFTAIMDNDSAAYPIERRPLVIRARGKATIPIVIRMLTHFNVNFAVLHDVDPLFTKAGDKANPSFAVNASITYAIAEARKAGVKVTHRYSCPGFELQHKMDLPTKDKPLNAWRSVTNAAGIKATVKAILDELNRGIDSAAEANDGASYEKALLQWIADSATTELCYKGIAGK